MDKLSCLLFNQTIFRFPYFRYFWCFWQTLEYLVTLFATQGSLNSSQDHRSWRKWDENSSQVKLITCFHYSWIYDFFSQNFLCFIFLQGRSFRLRSKMLIIYLFIITEKDTLQASEKLKDFMKKCVHS